MDEYEYLNPTPKSRRRPDHPGQQRLFAAPNSVPARGQQGIESSHDHAEADDPGWTERAATALRDYAQANPFPFTIEKAREHITAAVGAPDELRAWGAVTLYASRRGWIAKTGGYHAAASSNGSPKPLYAAPEAP